MSQMLKSSGAMAAATLTSRVLGMVREIVYSGFMGVGWVNGAFQLAFTIPNLFRRLLGEGALTASFIPIFKEKERTATPKEMWRAANAVISGLLVAAGAITVLAIVGITIALAVGVFPAKTDLMLRLVRVMFPYMLLVCLAAIFMGILNARGHFFIPATGTVMMNVVLIASVFLIAPLLGQELHKQIFGLAIGVLLAGLAQALFQLPTLRGEGFRYQWVSPWGEPTVKRVVHQMIPGTIGVAAFQLNVAVTQSIAFAVDPSILASFNFAVRLMELPQGVFGISLATFLLPTLSGLAADKKFGEFRGLLRHGLEHLVFINVLASVLLFLLAEPIIRLLFQHGRFDEQATQGVTEALVFMAPGLVLFSVNNILARAFYALGDTRTPMRISVFCLAVNLVFAMVLVTRYRQGGLALANTMSAAINLSLLLYALRRKLGRLELSALRTTLLKTGGAVILAGLVAWGGHRWWNQAIGHAGLWRQLGDVFVPMTAASLVYLVVTLQLRVASAAEMGTMLFRRLGFKGAKLG